jgi:hypothetical protein
MAEVRLASEALDELSEAASWYEKRSEGLKVEAVLQRIEALPESFPPCWMFPKISRYAELSFPDFPMLSYSSPRESRHK